MYSLPSFLPSNHFGRLHHSATTERMDNAKSNSCQLPFFLKFARASRFSLRCAPPSFVIENVLHHVCIFGFEAKRAREHKKCPFHLLMRELTTDSGHLETLSHVPISHYAAAGGQIQTYGTSFLQQNASPLRRYLPSHQVFRSSLGPP